MSDDNHPADNQQEQKYNAAKDWYDFKPPNEALDYEPVYATLHFYYNDPDSMRRFRLCNQAENMKLALWEFDQWLRNEAKYGDATPEYWDTCAGVRRKFLEITDEHGIDLTED